MAGEDVSFEFNPGELMVNLHEFGPKVDAAVARLFDYYAAAGEAKMKREAPWHDRTGNARNGLHADAQHEPGQHQIELGHGVSYGIYLETRWAGRYAIVEPTTITLGRQVMKGLDNLFSKIPGGA